MAPTETISVRLRPAVILTLLLASLSGCGGKSGEQVTGTISLQGKPLAGVVVTLIPEAGGPKLVGSSDDKGQFTAIAQEATAKIAPGSYKVVVSDPAAASKNARAGDPYNADQKSAANPVIPAIFTSETTTKAKVDVQLGKPVAIDLVP